MAFVSTHVPTVIVCITPNPALDHTLTVPRLRPGAVMRATQARLVAGGKGLNVARAIQTLGGEPLCLGFVGGHSGRHFMELAAREGFHSRWTSIENETRQCVILVSADGSEATVVNEPGPRVTAQEWTRLQEDAVRAAPPQALVCFCGSLPPGSPLEGWSELLATLRSQGRWVWVDTSTAPLQAALSVGGLHVKVNGSEAGEILQRTVAEVGSAFEAARELRARGAATVVLTLGNRGAVLVNGGGEWHVPAPQIQATNTVGSGDSFLAGLVMALSQGADLREALRWAVAAGAANAQATGGGHFTRDVFEAMRMAIPSGAPPRP